MARIAHWSHRFVRRWPAACLALVVLAAACEGPGGKAGTAPSGAGSQAGGGDGRVVATYGGDTMSAQEFIDLASRLNARSRRALQDVDRRALFIENQVVQDLVYEEGLRLGFEKDSDIRSQIQDLEKRLVIQKVMAQHQGGEVTEDDIRAYYDANREEFSTDRIRVSHILVKEEELAKKLVAELKEHPDRFAKLAEEHSIDQSNAAAGGDLGFFGKGRMVSEFEDAAFALAKDGEVSGVVSTRFGFHIIKRMAREDGHVREYDDVRNQIRIRLANDRRRAGTEAFLAKVKQDAKLEVNREVLASIELPDAREAKTPTSR